MGKEACRITGFSITALTAGALLAGCAPPPGGVGSAPQAGGGRGSNAAPETSGSARPGSDQSGSGGSDQSGSSRSSSIRSSSPSTSKSAERIVVKTGEGSSRGEVEPEKLELGNVDDTQVDDVEWSSWGGGQAVGKGTLKIAGGDKGRYENTKITLRIPTTYGGDKQYTRYTISAPGLPNEKANSYKFQPTNHVVQEAEQANEVYVTEGGGPYASPEQRPGEFSAGGVGHMRMEDVDWTSWNGPTAVGRGTLVINTCQPACANGALDVYQNGAVKLTETKDVAGKKQYTKFTMTAPGLPPEDAEVLTDQPIE